MAGLHGISMHRVLQALDQNLQTRSCCVGLEGQTKRSLLLWFDL